MLAVFALLAALVAYFLFSEIKKQEKEIKTLKRDFGELLDVAEPALASAAAPPPPEPPEPEMGPAPPPPQAAPYGARRRNVAQDNEPRNTTPIAARGPASAMDVPAPSGGGAGVSLEALSGGNDYSALF